jgi:disease resistance protein RPS2
LNLVPAALDRPDLHGIIGYETKVLEFLEHGTASLLAISGERGIGKSTLLKLVYTSIRWSFRYVFFVEAGTRFTSDMLQDVLASYIGMGPMPGFPTADRIASFLRDESFVLLVDDVCSSFDLTAAGLPMPLGPQQKVVFTTRDEIICDEMASAGDNIKMECMANDVAWDLFKYCARAETIDANPEIKNIAMKVSRQLCFQC